MTATPITDSAREATAPITAGAREAAAQAELAQEALRAGVEALLERRRVYW